MQSLSLSRNSPLFRDTEGLLLSPQGHNIGSIQSQMQPLHSLTTYSFNLLATEFFFKFQHTPYLKCEQYRNQTRQHYEMNGILKRKNGDYTACLKYSVRIFVEKNIKWGIQRVILRPSYIWDARFVKVKMQNRFIVTKGEY